MKTRAAVCRAFGQPLSHRGGRTRRARPGRDPRQDQGLRDLPQRRVLLGRRLGRRIAGGLWPRGGGRRRGGRPRRDAGEGRRSRGGDADPLLRLLPVLRRRRAGVLRGGVPARSAKPAARRRRREHRPRHAHRRLRRACRRRITARSSAIPEGHAVRRRLADRLRRADRLSARWSTRRASAPAAASSSSAAAASG